MSVCVYAFFDTWACKKLSTYRSLPSGDLSARNLLVGAYDAADGAYPVRVADFGLSRLADASGEYSIVKSPSPTRVRRLCGCVCY